MVDISIAIIIIAVHSCSLPFGVLASEHVVPSVQIDILSLQWMDKRKVTVISTLHNDDMVSKRRRTRLASDGIEEIMKPKVISDYNTHVGGVVDKADQLLSYYSFTRWTMKWWKRVFSHLVDVAKVNSYIMYSESLQDGRKLTHEQFRVEVASSLLLQVGMSERDIEESIQYTDTIPQPLRLVGKHFPTHLPPCSSGRIRQSVCCV